MNILILEDRGSVSYYLEVALKLEKHAVLSAASVYDAQEYWENREKVAVDAIIMDLNMSPEGLTDDEKKKTQEGLFTGWVWLKSRVFSVDAGMARRTIIYSEYVSKLSEVVSAAELDGITLVDKRGSGRSTAPDVLRRVSAIAAGLRRVAP